MHMEVVWGLAALLAGSLGIIGVMRMFSKMAYPSRERLYTLAAELIADPRTTDAQRDRLNRMMDRALCFSEGWILVRASGVGVGMAMRGERLSDLQQRIIARLDQRFVEATGCFTMSVAAANPLAMLVSIPLAMIAMAIETHSVRMQTVAGHILMNPRAI